MDQKQVKNWLKENWFKLGILAIGLIITYSAYQFLVVQPRIERNKAEENIEQCIADAKNLSRKKKADIDEFCTGCDKYTGNYTTEKQCIDTCSSLYTEALDGYKEAEDTCFQRFSTN